MGTSVALPGAQSQPLFGGRRILFLGDSITAGTGASSASLRFSTQSCRVAGTARAEEAVNGGNAGFRSDQLIPLLPGYLASTTIDHVHILVGTNDASQSIAPTTYFANIQSLVKIARTAGCTVSMGLVPPRGNGGTGAAAATVFIERYNLLLWSWARKQGIAIADNWTALVDPLTGYYQVAFDSGDSVHPSDAGHLAMAKRVGPAIVSGMVTGPNPVRAVSQIGLIANPLMNGTTGWTDQGGTATTFASATVPAQGGDQLSAGAWQTLEINNSAGGTAVFRQTAVTLDNTKYSAGDQIMVFTRMWHSDLTDASSLKCQVTNGGTSFGIIADTTGSVGNPGAIAGVFTVPGSPGIIRLGFSLTAAVATDVTAWWGQTQAYNLTTGGIGVIA